MRYSEFSASSNVKNVVGRVEGSHPFFPYEQMINWFADRADYEIGDFGCGEAKIAEALSELHTVHSFDHVALTEEVIACDMAHVPLENEVLDAAIFSLSLMGSNIEEYLLEAHRTLKLDGHLHIIEATSRFSDREAFAKQLESFGFLKVFIRELWKFTHIYAIKTSRVVKELDTKLKF
ncbi:MAG: methyltransferase domain-containing protein [Candidatus Hodarchaeota archaeon]